MGEDGSVINDNEHPLLQYVWSKFWVNNHAHVIKGKNGFSDEYILTFLKQLNVREIITGAVQLKINQGNLCGLKIIISNGNIISEANAIFSDLYHQYKINYTQNQNLATLRNTLLPKLMSGELLSSSVEKL